METQAQLDHLVDLRCDIAQGFHLGRPSSPELVEVGRVPASLQLP